MVIRFMFCNPRAWWKQPGSKLIQKVDNSKSSHFAIAVFGFGQVYVYESVFPKSRKIPYGLWLNEYKVESFYDYQVPGHLQYLVHEWLQMMVGKKYSVPQLALIALAMLAPLTKALNWAILNHDKALICTEYGSRFIEAFTFIELKKSHDLIGMNDMGKLSEEMQKNPQWVNE